MRLLGAQLNSLFCGFHSYVSLTAVTLCLPVYASNAMVDDAPEERSRAQGAEFYGKSRRHASEWALPID